MERQDHFVVCDCISDDHVIRFSYDPGDDTWEPELYVSVQLHQYRGFFRRVWEAIRYVFKRESRYGHWDVTLVSQSNAVQLRDYLDKVIKASSSNG